MGEIPTYSKKIPFSLYYSKTLWLCYGYHIAIIIGTIVSKEISLKYSSVLI